jgi:hypothetical protein
VNDGIAAVPPEEALHHLERHRRIVVPHKIHRVATAPVERQAGVDIVKRFGENAAEAEENHGAELGVAQHAHHKLPAATDLLLNQKALQRFSGGGLNGRGSVFNRCW